MAGRETRFEDTCQITGIKNDVSVVGEILTFRERGLIIATIARSAKVTLRWNDRVQLYFDCPQLKKQMFVDHDVSTG